jgi:hypothetical protein
MALLFTVFLVSGALAGPSWYQSLGLTKDQGKQLRGFNQAKSATIKQAFQEKEGNTVNLAHLVLSGAGDADLQPALGQVLSNLQTMVEADDNYWKNLQSFLTPGQVAKIYLKTHPDAAPVTPPARPKDGVNWAAYVGLTPAQYKQLKDTNVQWMGRMKAKVSDRVSTLKQLEASIQNGAPDAQVLPLLNTLLATVQGKHQTELDYYEKDLPAFLSPTQVAKLYLHRRPPKEGFSPPSGSPSKKK